MPEPRRGVTGGRSNALARRSGRRSYLSVTYWPFRNWERAMSVKTVGIVGSGIMGSGVAEVAAKSPASRSCCGAVRRRRADAMVAGLEKSLAKQVETGQARDADARRRARPGPRRHRPRRARRLRPRASSRSSRTSPRRSTSSASSTASAATARSSRPTRRRCPWSRWRWRPGVPSASAASTSSTRRR